MEALAMEMETEGTYTQEKSLRERMLETLKDMKMTKQELAMEIDYSRSAVSQYLGGKYASDPAEIEAGNMSSSIRRSRKPAPYGE